MTNKEPPRKPRNLCFAATLVLLLVAFIVFLTYISLAERPNFLQNLERSLPEDHALLMNVYDRRMELARYGVERMEFNLKTQGVLMVIAIMLLWSGIQKKSVDVQILGTMTPTRMLRGLELILPVGLMYLWIEFGYLYLDLLDNRILLIHLIDALEGPDLGPYSSRHVLPDHFVVIDPWFLLFGNADHAASLREGHFLWISVFKMLAFTGFLGASHASTLALICHHGYTGIRSSLRKQVALIAYAAVIVAAISATHIEFNVHGDKDNYGQYLIFGWAILLFCVMTRIGMKRAEPEADENLPEVDIEREE